MKKNSKIYIQYHFILVGLLQHLLGKNDAYDVHEFVSLGEKPIEADIVVIKKNNKDVNPKKSDPLYSFIKYFNNYNVIEYKGPGDSFDIEDYRKLQIYTQFICNDYSITENNNISMFSISSGLTKTYLGYYKKNNITLEKIEPGIYLCDDESFKYYAINLNELPVIEQNKLILLFSKKYYKHPEKLDLDYENEKMYCYVVQQILNRGDKKMAKAINRTITPDIQDSMEKELLKFMFSEHFLEKVNTEKIINAIGFNNILETVGIENVLNGIDHKIIEEYIKNKKKK